MMKIDALIGRRAEERRKTATARSGRILRAAEDRGIRISRVGSLTHDRFRIHSDIDLPVHGPVDPARRATVERLVADALRGTGIPYDLVFEADIGPERTKELLHDHV